MNKKLFAALTCALMVFVSCDKLKDATSHDFNVSNVKFKFEAPTSGNAVAKQATIATRAGTDNNFTVTRIVNLSEMGNSDVIEYSKKISNVKVNSSQLNITSTPAGGYTVADVKVTAVGVKGELLVSSYTLGSTFSPPANMNAYTAAFVKELIKAGTVSVTVSGKTDAPAGTTININYESDLVLTASVL